MLVVRVSSTVQQLPVETFSQLTYHRFNKSKLHYNLYCTNVTTQLFTNNKQLQLLCWRMLNLYRIGEKQKQKKFSLFGMSQLSHFKIAIRKYLTNHILEWNTVGLNSINSMCAGLIAAAENDLNKHAASSNIHVSVALPTKVKHREEITTKETKLFRAGSWLPCVWGGRERARVIWKHDNWC